MTLYDQAVELIKRMTLAEKARLAAYLSATLKQAVEAEGLNQIPWEQFIERTYGSLADDPIERDQPTYSDRGDEIA